MCTFRAATRKPRSEARQGHRGERMENKDNPTRAGYPRYYHSDEPEDGGDSEGGGDSNNGGNDKSDRC